MSIGPSNPDPSPISNFFAKAKETVEGGIKFVSRKIKENESLVKKVALVALGIILFSMSPMTAVIGGLAGLAVGLVFPKQVDWVVGKVKDAWNNSGVLGKVAMGAAGAASMFLLPTMVPSLMYGAYCGSLIRRQSNAGAGAASAVAV